MTDQVAHMSVFLTAFWNVLSLKIANSYQSKPTKICWVSAPIGRMLKNDDQSVDATG